MMTQTELQIIILIVVAIGASIFANLDTKKQLENFWSRGCSGAEWRRQFPQATKESIREFLECFVEGFAFDNKERLKFTPNDKIMEIYRALYPTEGWPDALELETFAINLEKKYRFDLAGVFTEELTLGQIFKMATSANPNQADTPV
ncbi:hypothetical protein E4633_09025 [Geomonas terrae]|uniref:Uncharacterized protein n=1 Tax=Geomonas terrae TaxID=2562681 RepID=A0A4S1CH77_9BACT|nr:hypothetical protein [Geomonas terrae]TGU72436.1 hypothetical protein E4633_09025 [Geomonas terrae]